jgi:hypothetical protein
MGVYWSKILMYVNASVNENMQLLLKCGILNIVIFLNVIKDTMKLVCNMDKSISKLAYQEG